MIPSIRLSLVSISLSAVVASALAQPAAAPSILPTVTVKGRNAPADRRTPNLATGTAGSDLETPFSIDAVPSDVVREQAGTTLQDALRNVPGAQADSGFVGSHSQFFILRGAVTDSGTGSNRVLRDGVRLSNYPYVPAFVESVDVLRGPGAAIGVRSEPGGTVNLTTRRPRLGDFGSLHAALGERGEHELSVDFNRILSVEREIAARVIATRSAASEWRHVPDRLDGVKLGLAQSGGERWHLGLGLEATNQTYRPDYGLPAIGGRVVDVPRDRQLGEPYGDSTTKNRIVDAHADVLLGAETRLTADHTHLEGDSTAIRNVLVGSPLANQPPGTFARASSEEPGTTRRIRSTTVSLTSTRTSMGLTHRLYAAVDHYTETLSQPTLSIPASTSPGINVYDPVYGRVTAPAAGTVLPVSLTTENLEAFGGSLQDTIDVGAWTFVAGLRGDRQRFVYGAVGTLAMTEHRWSPKFALLRRLGADDTVYANVSTGVSPNQVASSTNQSLPFRRAKQVELGWKSLWLGGRLASDLAVYRLDQKNMISADTSTPANLFDFTVNGAARSQGIEASLSGRMTERIDLIATYAYTDAAYRENAVYGFNRVPNVARHTGSLWARYAWDASWRTAVVVSAQSRRFADEANTTVLPGYARFDLVQTWSKRLSGQQSIELQFAVRNVFDKEYQVSSHLHVARWITPGRGRNAMVAAAYRF